MNRQFKRRQGRAAGGGNQSQAQQMQAQLQKLHALQELQEELETMTAEGTAGGGVVKVVMTGKQTIGSVEIDPEALEDVELLQDLIAAAFNDAISKTQELAAAKMGSITGGMNIPGLT